MKGFRNRQGLPSFALWTILDQAGIPGHPFESTVADSTIRALGYDPYEPREETPP